MQSKKCSAFFSLIAVGLYPPMFILVAIVSRLLLLLLPMQVRPVNLLDGVIASVFVLVAAFRKPVCNDDWSK